MALAACAPAPRPQATLGGTIVPATPSTAPVDDPAAVGARLASVEAAIRAPSTPDDDVARLGREQQDIYRLLAERLELQAAVVATVPPELRPAVGANLEAGTELAQLAQPRPELPRWRIVAPAPVPELLAAYRRAAAATGVGWQYLAAIHLVETAMGRIRGTSTAGAQGPMQFMPATWAAYGGGGDINSDADAISAAARLLARNGAPADMARALFAYNPSQHYVRAITAYAGVMAADPRTYAAYHAWQVYYGDALLPEGWSN